MLNSQIGIRSCFKSHFCLLTKLKVRVLFLLFLSLHTVVYEANFKWIRFLSFSWKSMTWMDAQIAWIFVLFHLFLFFLVFLFYLHK